MWFGFDVFLQGFQWIFGQPEEIKKSPKTHIGVQIALRSSGSCFDPGGLVSE